MSDAKATVGFLGLGNMGAIMSRRLLQAGWPVVGYDLSADRVRQLAAEGGTAVESAEEVARAADILILMLPDSNVVESVLIGQGIERELRRDAIVVDMGSSEPLRTRELSARLRALNVQFVDAPVSGGVSGALGGRLAIMAGGDDASIGRVAPVLNCLGAVTHVGPVGAGHALKALNNLMSAVHFLATSEALVTGREFGLDPNTMLEVCNASSGRSGSTENKWPNFVLTERFDSGFGLRLMLKDMRIAESLAVDLGTSHELSSAAVARWAAAAEALPADADHTRVADWVSGASTDTREPVLAGDTATGGDHDERS